MKVITESALFLKTLSTTRIQVRTRRFALCLFSFVLFGTAAVSLAKSHAKHICGVETLYFSASLSIVGSLATVE